MLLVLIYLGFSEAIVYDEKGRVDYEATLIQRAKDKGQNYYQKTVDRMEACLKREKKLDKVMEGIIALIGEEGNPELLANTEGYNPRPLLKELETYSKILKVLKIFRYSFKRNWKDIKFYNDYGNAPTPYIRRKEKALLFRIKEYEEALDRVEPSINKVESTTRKTLSKLKKMREESSKK